MNASSSIPPSSLSFLDLSLQSLRLPFHLSKTAITLPLVLLYPFVQHALRYRRERSKLKKYGYAGLSRKEGRRKMRKMTLDEAGEIQRYMLEWEFPNAFISSLTYGFIQTLAFPESSALLHSTNEISSAENSPKRFIDTSLLVENFISFPPSSPRARAAISRMNYLHGVYGKKITNEQLLYVLGVFASNPWKWVKEWEWREMNDMETGAMAVFWKGIGDMMGIDMAEMKGMAKGHPDYSTSWDSDAEFVGDDKAGGPATWNDPIDWMLDMRAYIEYHDEIYLDHSPAVEALVKQTLESALILVPEKWRAGAVDLLFVRFENKYMKAIRAREPSTRTRQLGLAIANYKRLYLKHFGLPRFFSVRKVDETPNPATGRYYVKVWITYPQYVKNTFWYRWIKGVWVSRLLGGPIPGDQGDWWQPEGYKLEEVGPRRYIGKGHEWMAKDVKFGEQVMPSGKCPFAM